MNTVTQSNDVPINDPNDDPTDTVSCIVWSPNITAKRFACSAWDSTIRLFDINTTDIPSLKCKSVLKTEHPCLSICWESGVDKLFAGSIDGSIRAFDLTTSQPINIGQHEGVKDLHWIAVTRTLCSLGFDKKIRFWDQRQQKPLAEFDIRRKIFCSDIVFPTLALGLSGEKIALINLPTIQKMMSSNLVEQIDSPLDIDSQLTNIVLSQERSRIMTSSHDGRINLSKVIEDGSARYRLANIITFKAQYSDDNRGRVLYPVHSAGFHPTVESFLYSVGADRRIIFWDYKAKQKIRQFQFELASVTKAKLSPDGTLLAYALGYDWTKGVQEDMSCYSSVNVHIMQQEELRYM